MVVVLELVRMCFREWLVLKRSVGCFPVERPENNGWRCTDEQMGWASDPEVTDFPIIHALQLAPPARVVS